MPVMFDNMGCKKVLMDDFCRRAVRDVDRSEVINENLVLSPVLGEIWPNQLSGGAMCLIILYRSEDPIPIRASKMGPNCAKLLYELSKTKDIHLYVNYTDFFKDFRVSDEFEAIDGDSEKRYYKYGDFFADVILGRGDEIIYTPEELEELRKKELESQQEESEELDEWFIKEILPYVQD